MIPLLQWILKRPGTFVPVFFLSLFSILKAQYHLPGTSSAGLAGCVSALSGISGIDGNQGGLGWSGDAIICAEYAMPFTMKELGYAGLSATIPALDGNLGGKLVSGGIRGYREHSLWLSYGLRLGKQFSAGAGLFYNITSTGNKIVHHHRTSFAGGIQVRLSEQLIIGGHVRFPYQYSNPGSPYRRLQAAISLGGALDFFQSNTFYAECELNEITRFSISAGVKSVLGKLVILQTGFRTSPATFSFGTGFKITKMEIRFASQMIYKSGSSTFFGIHYEL